MRIPSISSSSCRRLLGSAAVAAAFLFIATGAAHAGGVSTTTELITTTTVLEPACGNFVVEPGEQCDDGNTVSGDGCNSTCQTEFCGDHVVNDCTIPRGRSIGFCPEQCDDGNTVSGDGCSANCKIEFCGDGVTNNMGTEQCDDANTDNTDACVNCQVATCGDGFVHTGFEQCDDANTDNTDGCVNCQLATCGDGFVQTDVEQCDDANTASGDGCSSDCTLEFCGDGLVNNGTETCDDANTDNTDACVNCHAAACGDGFVYAGFEQCDDANTVSGDGCSSTCVLEFCGDGVVNDGGKEQCDDGNTSDADFCKNNCTLATCGDGIINQSSKVLEQCDDGNTASGDGCSSTCTLESGACCFGQAQCSDVTASACADLKGSFSGAGTSCKNSSVCVNCGDGVLEFGETCDDANNASGDGCSSTCTVETCWKCSGAAPTGDNPPPSPSVCTPDDQATCDDGKLCTLSDHCSNGDCVGSPPIIPAACDWVIVGGNPTKTVQIRTRGEVDITGHSCAKKTRIGDTNSVNGDVIATEASGTGSQWGALTDEIGDICTGGSAISGRPSDVTLPGLNQFTVAAGSSAVQTDNPTRDLDATGGCTRVADCQDAIDTIVPSTGLLDNLNQTDNKGKVEIPISGSLTLTATGALNVIDFRKLFGGDHSNLILDGANIPGVAFVLRVSGKIYLSFDTTIQLINGADASRVIIYGKGLCKYGQKVTGKGTAFCPNGKIKVDQNSTWDGALISGKKRVDLRHQAAINHVPLLLGAP
ncbi:MAG TPA: DUF4215 domain-containing protein [Candidatus Binatia bacterium]|jgi:cysteine-rich repeat protein